MFVDSGAELKVAVSWEEKELCVTIPGGSRMSRAENGEDMVVNPRGKTAVPGDR